MDFPTRRVGEYTVLVLGDTDPEHYTIGTESTEELILDKSHISDVRIDVKHDNNTVSRQLGSFFIGKIEGVIVDGIGHRTETAILVKNTKNIHLTINGLGHLPDFTPHVKSRNGSYNSDNTIPETAPEIKYTPHTTTRTTREVGVPHISQISTLRIMQDHNIPLITEYENGDKVDEIGVHDLVSLIKTNPKYKTQADLDNETEFRIVLNYTNETLISITINNWNHVIVTPEV